MFPKRIVCLLALLACLAGTAVPAYGAETDCDTTYCFSAGDFSQDAALTGICITGLPDAATGTIMLGARVLQPGDILTAAQLAEMTFSPLLTQADQEAVVTYLPIYADRVEATATMSISVLGKTDQAPVAEDSAIETYRNLPNEAQLKVKDPEGQALTYTVTRQPKRGEVAIREDGSFIYTPKKNKVGVDSFTYTAADPAGNVSREATVTITIIKPTDASQYTDTAGKSCRFAAEWMKNTGIFVSENFGGNGCFRPEKEVTCGEFVTMMVRALEIPVDEAASTAGIPEETPDWLKPYLSAALRSGLTAGFPAEETFNPGAPITGAQAAVLLQNALDLSSEAGAGTADELVPVWAADALTVMEGNGIALPASETLNRGQVAEALYQATQLAANAPGMSAIRAAQ